MKKAIRCLVVLAIMILSFETVVFAASPAPYGFTYDNVANGRTVYMYYKYNAQRNVYEPAKEYYSKGNKLYNSNGAFVADVYASSGQYAGFDKNGKFYIITPTQQLLVVESSKKTLLNSGCLRLAYNSDSIATAVVTSGGWKSLATLKPVPAQDDDDSPAPRPLSANRVQQYTNSAGEMVYEGIQNNKVKIRLIVSKAGNNVLNATAKVRLSDTLKGAKFIGLDQKYNVYLYEGSTLYRFKYGKWYSAEKVTLQGTYRSFTNDKNGFISKVVTSSNSYTIQQLVTADWRAARTYVVKKSNYMTLYIKGKTTSYTLQKKSNGALYFNGKKIATGVSKYGFTSKKKIIYIKGNTCYVASLSKPLKTDFLFNKVKSLVTNSYNLVTKVKLVNGKTQALK